MRLAETKRVYIFSEAWNTLGSLGALDNGVDIYLGNAFAPIAIGTADNNQIANEIIDPFLVFRLSMEVNFGALFTQYGNTVPMVRVDVALVAVNDQLYTSGVPQGTSIGIDELLFIRHPDYRWLWQFNGNNVTVIKKRSILFRPNVDNPSVVTRSVKVTKRLRGKKQFETNYTNGGVPSVQNYLKGYNYYWIVIASVNRQTSVNSVGANPVRIIGDRYIYFKDL